MGAFDKIPTEGSVTVSKLAADLGVDQNLLGKSVNFLV